MLSFVFEEVSMLWVAGMSAVGGGDIFSKHFIPFEWYNDLATISFSMPLTCISISISIRMTFNEIIYGSRTQYPVSMFRHLQALVWEPVVCTGSAPARLSSTSALAASTAAAPGTSWTVT